MVPVLAHESMFPAAFVYLVAVGVAVILLSPISAVVNWLKGRRVLATVLAVTLVANVVIWPNYDWYLHDAAAPLSFPIALVGLVAAFRLAKPGSWWFGRYKAEKLEGARWAWATSEGRRRRRKTSVAAGLSVVAALALGALAVSVFEDLTTTTWDEVYTGVILFVDAGEPSELDAIAARAEAAGAEFALVQSRWIDLGDDRVAFEALSGDECLFTEALDTVNLDISPPTDEAVDQVLEQMAPVPGLVAVSSSRGRPGAILETEVLDLDDEAYPYECETQRVSAYVDSADGETSLQDLRSEFEGTPGVVAIGLEQWRHEYLGYSEFPDLVACFGPREIQLFIEPGSDPAPVVSSLRASPLVVGLSWESEDGLGEFGEDAFLEDPYFQCEEHFLSVAIEDDMSDAEAASLLAAARRIPGVAHVDLFRWSADGIECPDCYEESLLQIVRGDLSLATMTAIGDAVCDEPGVLGVSGEHADDSGCPLRSLEVRISRQHEQAVEMVQTIVDAASIVYRTDVREPLDDAELPTAVIGSRNPHVCDLEGGRYWQVHVDFRQADPAEVRDLADAVGDIEGVVAVTGSAMGLDLEDPELCGVEVMALWLGDVTDGEKQAVVDLLDAQGVWAADLWPEDSHVGTDDNGSADTKWTGRIYLESWDAARVDELNELLRSTPGVVHTEVWTPDFE